MAYALCRDRSEPAALESSLTGRRVAFLVFGSAFLFLLIDAMVQPNAFFDLWVMQLVQRPDDPVIRPIFNTIRTMTGSEGAVIAWFVTGLAFLVRRWWAPAVVLGLIPLGGAINEVIGLTLVERVRPHLDMLYRQSLNFEEHSFPSGHVTGAVMLYGLLFVVARRIQTRALRLTIQLVSVIVLAVIGYQRVWGGAHWPSDVLAAYALGGLILLALLALLDALEPELAGRSLPGAIGHTIFLAAMAAARIGAVMMHRLDHEHRTDHRPQIAASRTEPTQGAAAHWLTHSGRNRSGSHGFDSNASPTPGRGGIAASALGPGDDQDIQFAPPLSRTARRETSTGSRTWR